MEEKDRQRMEKEYNRLEQWIVKLERMKNPENMEHTLRISGSIAKNLAVLIVAVMKDQKKTRGKTNLLRMLKEQWAMKFFTIPHDRLREFAGEAKSRGLLYVVIRDKKNPQFPEIMVFADDAAKVNRVLDKMNLFKELVHTDGLTIVMTTHDTAMMEQCDVVYTLDDGRITDVRKQVE